ncbi:MAG: homoserine dehydrogenase [Opitutaceae bacterium]|nr:homoserine dehydrogenase [Opitutaceae bacterium]
MKKTAVVSIGLCGLGTVGTGVWKHLARTRAELERRLGARLVVQRVAERDLRKARSAGIPASRLVSDALDVARDPALQIVCELIGGTTVAREVVLTALAAGKIVVTANKALLCAYGPEIFAAARRGGGHVFFEASVAGGVPIVKALREGLVANRFPLIYGILNGTCNYILTRMEEEQRPYAEVLADAKRLGYAEANESLDVEGWDTAHKASILAYLAHGRWVKTGQMLIEGITKITPTDIANAAALGYRIKLLAIITRDFDTNEVAVRVCPTLVPRRNVIANVNGVYNGISVTGDVVGTTLYIGRGAGQDATASAVISDIADAVTLLRCGKSMPTPDELPRRNGLKLSPLARMQCPFYLRLEVRDQPGVLARVATVTARHGVSIESVLQHPSPHPRAASLILTTHRSNEHALRGTVSALQRLGCVLDEPLLLRIADFAN